MVETGDIDTALATMEMEGNDMIENQPQPLNRTTKSPRQRINLCRGSFYPLFYKAIGSAHRDKLVVYSDDDVVVQVDPDPRERFAQPAGRFTVGHGRDG